MPQLPSLPGTTTPVALLFTHRFRRGAFFSSPIDPRNIWEDYGRSDEDRRHRLVAQGAIHSSMAPAKTAWQRVFHGFQLSALIQYYSALPFNITAGATTIQGTQARPMVNGVFIRRNAGTGFDYLGVSTRLSRTVRVHEGLRLEGIVEAFNSLNRVNGVTKNGTFGQGAYPSNPAPGFEATTSLSDSRSIQLALRLRF